MTLNLQNLSKIVCSNKNSLSKVTNETHLSYYTLSTLAKYFRIILVSLCVFESIRISNSTKRIYIEQRKRTQGLWTLWDLWNGDRFGKGFCVLFSLTVTVIIESFPCPRLKWHLSIQVSQIWSHCSLICCSNSKKNVYIIGEDEATNHLVRSLCLTTAIV